MKLLGRHNWYLPKWLEWIPNVSLGEQRVSTDEREGAVGKHIPVKPTTKAIPVPVEDED
jgi:RND superfamily putative drug exporter